MKSIRVRSSAVRTFPCIAFLALAAFAGCVTSDAPAPTDPPDPPTFAAGGRAEDGLPDHELVPSRPALLDLVGFGDGAGGVRVDAWADRAYVTTGNASDGVGIFDISDPWTPKRLGSVTEIAPREGIGVLDYGTRTVIVAAPSPGISFIEVTDPSEPVELKRVDVPSHTVGVYRPGFVVYNGGWTGGEVAAVEIIDARDPDDIKLHHVWEWGTTARDGTPIQPTACHDIVVDQAAARAFCAAQEQTTIWDLSDPFNPEVITVVNNPAAPHHNTAFSILDGSTLVIGVELAGCGPTAFDVTTPTGLWFFDLRTSPPRPMSWLSLESTDPNEPGIYGICAPHFGTEIADTGYLAFSWFGRGLVLIDASDPTSPRVVHENNEGGEASGAFYYRGLVLGAGEKGGLQVAALD